MEAEERLFHEGRDLTGDGGTGKENEGEYEQMTYVCGNIRMKPTILHKQKLNKKHLAIEVWVYF